MCPRLIIRDSRGLLTISKIKSQNGGLRTQEQRHNFLNLPNLLRWLDSNTNNIQSFGSVYNTDDLRLGPQVNFDILYDMLLMISNFKHHFDDKSFVNVALLLYA